MIEIVCVFLLPQLSAEIVQTNDIVELVNEKQFRFLGRFDHVINSGGVKVFPEMVEGFLKEFIDDELLISYKKDEFLGEKLVLVIEGKDDEYVRNRVFEMVFPNKFHQPKEIIFMDKIPRMENGKLNRLQVFKIIEND